MAGRRIETTYGYHAVWHLLSRRPQDVLEAYIALNKRPGARLEALRQACEAASIPVHGIAPAKLARLTGVKNHQGVAVRRRAGGDDPEVPTLAELSANPPAGGLILALDGALDPHNLGACIRSANAAGVEAALLPRNRSAPVNATVRKAASGAVETTPLITAPNLSRALTQLRQGGWQVIGAAGDGGETIYELDVVFPVVLVMGSEASGLRRNTRQHCDKLARIPMAGAVESLNLSVATGVCLYELARRRDLLERGKGAE